VPSGRWVRRSINTSGGAVKTSARVVDMSAPTFTIWTRSGLPSVLHTCAANVVLRNAIVTAGSDRQVPT
jgi:hypothetical protein